MIDQEEVAKLREQGLTPVQIARETGGRIAFKSTPPAGNGAKPPTPIERLKEAQLTAAPFRLADTPGGEVPGGPLEKDVDLHPLPVPAEPATKLSYELAFGEGTPFSQRFPSLYSYGYPQQMAITRDVLNKITNLVLQEVGSPEIKRVYGPGGWGTYPVTPSAQLDLPGDPETVRDVAAALGLLAQQTEVFASRPDQEGTLHALEVVEAPGGRKMWSPAYVQRFWRDLTQEEPRLAEGFLPVRYNQGGGYQHGIRIVNSGDYRWTEGDWRDFGRALDRVAERHGLQLDTDDPKTGKEGLTGIVKVQHFSEGNDWGEHSDGEGYQARLAQRLPSGVFGRMVGGHRKTAEAWIADAYRRHAGWSSDLQPAGQEPGRGGGYLTRDELQSYGKSLVFRVAGDVDAKKNGDGPPDLLKSLTDFEWAAIRGLPTDDLWDQVLQIGAARTYKSLGADLRDERSGKVRERLQARPAPQDAPEAHFLLNAVLAEVAEELGLDPAKLRQGLDPSVIADYYREHGYPRFRDPDYVDDLTYAIYPWEKSEDPLYYGDGGDDDPLFYYSVPAAQIPDDRWQHGMEGLGPQEHREHLADHRRELAEMQRRLAGAEPSERQIILALIRKILQHYQSHLAARGAALAPRVKG